MMFKTVYMDNAATTRMNRQVLEEMLPYFCEEYGNPSGTCTFSAKARNAVNTARERVAKLIGCAPDEIVFTSGGTEADNIAILGTAGRYDSGYARKPRMITDRIEHFAVLNCFKELERRGFDTVYVPCDGEGITDLGYLASSINENTGLVSIMTANNELGTLQDIVTAAQIAHEHGAFFHTDAVQAVGHISVDVRTCGADLLSISSHKLNGPKGIGALFVKRGMGLTPTVFGGGQEKGLRSGTLNVPAIVGFGKACEIAQSSLDKRMEDCLAKRKFLIDKIMGSVEGVTINGSDKCFIPGIVSLSFEKIEGSSLVIEMDMKGICCSTGSACSAHSNDVSHVLLAAGYDPERIRGSIRLSFSDDIDYDDLEYVAYSLKESVTRLRSLC